MPHSSSTKYMEYVQYVQQNRQEAVRTHASGRLPASRKQSTFSFHLDAPGRSPRRSKALHVGQEPRRVPLPGGNDNVVVFSTPIFPTGREGGGGERGSLTRKSAV